MRWQVLVGWELGSWFGVARDFPRCRLLGVGTAAGQLTHHLRQHNMAVFWFDYYFVQLCLSNVDLLFFLPRGSFLLDVFLSSRDTCVTKVT